MLDKIVLANPGTQSRIAGSILGLGTKFRLGNDVDNPAVLPIDHLAFAEEAVIVPAGFQTVYVGIGEVAAKKRIGGVAGGDALDSLQ